LIVVLAELITLQGRFWILQLSTIAMFVGLCFIEGVVTKRPMNQRPPRELVTDCFYWLLSPYFRVVSSLVVALVLMAVASYTGEQVAPRLVQGFGPLARQPKLLILLETLVLSDFTSYWAHRAMHRVSWLWRFHAVHHSAKTIRWSTIGRVHPVNEMLNYVIGVLPCIAIGLPLSTVISVVPVMMWWAVVAHSDFKLTWGPLRTWFVSPVFHRWHHTHSHEGGNQNFANIFALWDHLFGTYYLPSDRTPEVFGLDHDEMPENYLGQLLYPLGLSKPEPSTVLPKAPVANAASDRGLSAPERAASSYPV